MKTTSGLEKIHTILQCLRDLTGAATVYVPMGEAIENEARNAVWMDDDGPSSQHLAVLYDCESQDDGDVTCDLMRRLGGTVPHSSKMATRLTITSHGGIVGGMWYRVYRVMGEVK